MKVARKACLPITRWLLLHTQPTAPLEIFVYILALLANGGSNSSNLVANLTNVHMNEIRQHREMVKDSASKLTNKNLANGA